MKKPGEPRPEPVAIELRACPFCGERRKLEDASVPDKNGRIHWIYCRTCSMSGPTAPTFDASVAGWNVRM